MEGFLDFHGNSVKKNNSVLSGEYYELLKAAHESTDWNEQASIHAYNEYVREPRKQMEEDK